jgi:hypothetical protein
MCSTTLHRTGIVEVGDVMHVLEVRRVAAMLGAGAGILRIKFRYAPVAHTLLWT